MIARKCWNHYTVLTRRYRLFRRGQGYENVRKTFAGDKYISQILPVILEDDGMEYLAERVRSRNNQEKAGVKRLFTPAFFDAFRGMHRIAALYKSMNSVGYSCCYWCFWLVVVVVHLYQNGIELTGIQLTAKLGKWLEAITLRVRWPGEAWKHFCLLLFVSYVLILQGLSRNTCPFVYMPYY